MKMDKCREEYLVTRLGAKYHHHSDVYVFTSRGMWSAWEYFGRLWEWSIQQEWWGHFKEQIIAEEGDGTFGPLKWPISEFYIEPDNFATVLYLFLTVTGDAWKKDRGY